MGSAFLTRLPEIFIELIAFAFAISVHESSHGLAADRLGDPTARWLGRITLNPIKHIDPFGTIVLPIVLAIMQWPPLGWAKPVPYVPRNLRNQRWGPALVAAAGPGANLVVACAGVLVMVLVKLVVPDFGQLMLVAAGGGAERIGGIAAPLAALLFFVIWVNLALALFNLIPIPPMDGSKIFFAALPGPIYSRLLEVERYGMLIVFVLGISGALGWMLSFVLRPTLRLLAWLATI